MIKRLFTYFNAMFPLHLHLPNSILVFFSFYSVSNFFHKTDIEFSSSIIFGPITIFLAMLLMRLLDEIKDEGFEADIFPDRPLVTGAVKYSDIRILILICILSLVGLNLFHGISTNAFLILFVWIVLSWQWWMFEKFVSNNIWLVFLTHQTLVPLLFTYIYSVYLFQSNETYSFSMLLMCMVYWLPLFTWEIARKIRAPEDEDNYLTYTKRWGTKNAVMVVIAAIFLAGSGMFWFGFSIVGSLFLQIYYPVLTVGVLIPIYLFYSKPISKRNIVRPVVEAFVMLFQAGPIIYRYLILP